MNAQRYRKSSQRPGTTIELDGVTERVYSAIDGNSALTAIAKSAGVSIPVLWQTIAKLKRLGLIEEGVGNAGSMGLQFANKVQRELTKAVGPMSNVLIQKVAILMKFTWPYIPTEHTREFIYRLLVHIPNEAQKDEFKTTMLNEL